jgi:predicted nuclease with TOPRIM domain
MRAKMETAPTELINELQRTAAMVQVQKKHIHDLEKEFNKLRRTFIDLLDQHNELRERSGIDYDRTQTDYEWFEKAGILD